MKNAFNIEHLYKKYIHAEYNAVDDLSLQFPKGIIAGILGPNGAGKTTTISILCGILNADSGTANVLGFDCQKDKQTIQRRIGVVPQQTALFPQLTGFENLMYIGKLYKIQGNILKERLALLAEQMGLTDHLHKRLQYYSGGMKRRANIIAGLLHQPEILILDEPTAGVDVQSRAMILDFLKQYNQEGNTILYTSHLLDEAEKICDEVAIIDQGKLIIKSTPSNLIKSTPNCQCLEDVFLYYTGRKLRE